jgi:hypothetical protein
MPSSSRSSVFLFGYIHARVANRDGPVHERPVYFLFCSVQYNQLMTVVAF